MAAESYAVSELEIIGYMGSFEAHRLPITVRPIFRCRNNPSRILVPPYNIVDARVLWKTAIDTHELERMQREDGTVTLLIPKTFREPRPGYEMWVDEYGLEHYTRARFRREYFRRVADESLLEAEDALVAGDYERAYKQSSIAIAASHRAEPLAIKAALRILNGDKNAEAAAEEIVIERFRDSLRTYSAIISNRLI